LPHPPPNGIPGGVESLMRKILLALILLGGCGGSDPAANRAAAPAAGNRAAGSESAAPEKAAPGGGPTSIVGLWEGGSAEHRNQLCLLDKAGKTQFGVVVWGPNLNSCAGAGEAERKGDRITLRMNGDSACTIEAGVEAGRIVFRRAAGPGCETYYCGHAARFEGAAFSQQGRGAAAARKATDIAGDPLCG
jgi:hypothetical protein